MYHRAVVVATVFVGVLLIGRVTAVELCPGVDVDNTGGTPIGDALAKCLEQAFKKNQSLTIQPGVYVLNVTVKGSIGTTLEVAGATSRGTCMPGSDHCATFRAHPSLNGPLFDAKFLSLSHVILDGNRANRRNLLGSCRGGHITGFTANLGGGGDHFQFSAFINTVCGAALNLVGSGLSVSHCYFADNGEYDSGNQADGVSVAVSEGSRFENNHFVDNTGSAIALGGGAGIQVTGNRIEMKHAQAYAGLTLDTLHGPHSSQFYSAQFSKNHIDCNRGKCFFGIMIGSKPLQSRSEPVIGGSVHGNNVTGATVNINVDSATQWTLNQNTYGQTAGHFSHCPMPQTQLNISPDSQVDRKGEKEPSALKNSYSGCLP